MPGLSDLKRRRCVDKIRAEPADADLLGHVVFDRERTGGQKALPAELRLELAGEEVLELVGLDAEDVRPEEAVSLDAVGDDLRRGPPGKIGLDVDDARAIDAQRDEGREVAAAGVGALARIEGHRLHDQIRRPGLEPDRLVEIRFGPFAQVGVGRRVLLLAFKDALAAFDSHAHQRVEVFDFRPEQHRAGVHFGAVFFVEAAGSARPEKGTGAICA